MMPAANHATTLSSVTPWSTRIHMPVVMTPAARVWSTWTVPASAARSSRPRP
jgi:hypothetical protein